jgi:hypothetical protein
VDRSRARPVSALHHCSDRHDSFAGHTLRRTNGSRRRQPEAPPGEHQRDSHERESNRQLRVPRPKSLQCQELEIPAGIGALPCLGDDRRLSERHRGHRHGVGLRCGEEPFGIGLTVDHGDQCRGCRLRSRGEPTVVVAEDLLFRSRVDRRSGAVIGRPETSASSVPIDLLAGRPGLLWRPMPQRDRRGACRRAGSGTARGCCRGGCAVRDETCGARRV